MQVALYFAFCGLFLYAIRVIWKAQRMLDQANPLFTEWAEAIEIGDEARGDALRRRIVQIADDHNRYVRRHGMGWLAIPPIPRSPYLPSDG